MNPNQQHRRTIGEGVVAVSATPPSGPPAAESNDAVIAITIHLQGIIAGTRQIEYIQCAVNVSVL
jgi:hypothetical protein